MFMIIPHNAANGAAIHQLLLVPLDDGGRTHLGLIRILAELAPRVPLPQEIPTLIELDLDGLQPYLIVIGQFALPVEMLLLVNKTFDLLQDGMIGRRFTHVNHLADSPLSLSPDRCRDSDLWTADRSLETTARWFRRVRLLGGAVPALVVDGCAKRQRVQWSCTPRQCLPIITRSSQNEASENGRMLQGRSRNSPTDSQQPTSLTAPHRIRALRQPLRNRRRSAPWALRSARSRRQPLRSPLWEVLHPTRRHAQAWGCRPTATGRP